MLYVVVICYRFPCNFQEMLTMAKETHGSIFVVIKFTVWIQELFFKDLLSFATLGQFQHVYMPQ